MNNIVYAGNVAEGERLNANRKYCEIIYTGSGGKLLSDGGKKQVPSGGACLIPALVKREYSGSSGDICVLIEQPVFPYRETRVFAADSFVGLPSAILQAVEAYGREGYGGVLSALGNLIAAYIYAADSRAFSPVVENVIAAIEKNVGDSSFSLEDYMHTLPLNYDYIRKLFAKETGVTPHGYLMNKRIARVKSIMDSGVANRYSNYSVSQIAEAGGFSDPLYFSRVFKKYCGVSPSEYLGRVKHNKKI